MDGVTYNYRSAQLTASSGLSAGSKSYSLALADSAGNTESQSFSVTVDNGPFKGSDFETGNSCGGTEGKPEKGDTVSFEFNNAPDAKLDRLRLERQRHESGHRLDHQQRRQRRPRGQRGDDRQHRAERQLHVESTATFSASTISLSGSTVTIVLGAASGSIKTDSGKSKAVWTPSASNYDLAGNACSTSNVTGANKKQF